MRHYPIRVRDGGGALYDPVRGRESHVSADAGVTWFRP